MKTVTGWLLTTILVASCSSERQATTEAMPAPAAQESSRPTARTESRPDAVVTAPMEKAPPPRAAQPADAPGGILPLTRGVFVRAGTGCASPPNTGVRFYDGRGISGSATHACRTTIRSRHGDNYRVEQSCIDTPAGDGPRMSEPQTMTVRDARSLTQATGNESARFRHCPTDEVPDYLRQRMTQDHVEG